MEKKNTMVYQEKLYFLSMYFEAFFPFFFYFSKILKEGQGDERKKVKTKRSHYIIHQSR